MGAVNWLNFYSLACTALLKGLTFVENQPINCVVVPRGGED